MVSKRRAEEVQNSLLPQQLRGRVHMLKSFCKSRIVSIEKIAVLTLTLSLMGAGAAFAAAGGIPGRPIFTPPPPPCISTGFLSEDGFSVGCYTCTVRNVGAVSHTIAVDIRDEANLADSGRVPLPVAPGQSTGAGFCPPANVTSSDACVVVTDEGTTDALQDLAVVLQFSSPAGETEGKIFNSCAPRSGIANQP